MHVNPKLVVAGQYEVTHPDHCQEDDDGAKYSLSWCDTRDLLRETQGFDGHIQRG